MMLQYIEVNKIDPHPDNPRKDLGDLTELAESIKANGILQNLTVVPWFSEITRAPADDNKMDGQYRVVIGHRRLAAAKQAGLKEVPCIISDMSLREQVATMLLENIQRSDLTIYEQAQGFQMMLNFGDTVNDIAERTGFSQTTVRRRVKLLELDQKKFKESIERGATLMDYAELEKVKNPELRNSVLEHIGTSNFNWKLQQAIEKEKAEKNMVVLLEQLSEIATEVKETPKDYRYYKTYYPSRESEFEMPENAGEIKYLYKKAVSEYGYVTLYSEYVETPVDAAEKEQRQRQEARRNALDEITQRAYKLRREYVMNISNARAKKQIGAIIEDAVYAMLESHNILNHESLAKMLNMKDNDEWNFEDIVDDLRQEPERYMLIAAYCILDNSRKKYYDGWNCAYKKNKELDRVYELLEALGYEISDEEYAMCNGNHELLRIFEQGLAEPEACDVDEEPEILDHDPDGHGTCRVCGCTDDAACPGGCYWVEPDLCSRCAELPELEISTEAQADIDELLGVDEPEIEADSKENKPKSYQCGTCSIGHWYSGDNTYVSVVQDNGKIEKQPCEPHTHYCYQFSEGQKKIADDQHFAGDTAPSWCPRLAWAEPDLCSACADPEPDYDQATEEPELKPTPVAYIHDGKKIFVSAGLGSQHGTFWRSPSGGLHRVKSPAMPMVGTAEEAQANLDAWAEKKGLRSVVRSDSAC